jgi:DUF4097 and DUF4098 domain-containing protein YvlB
MRIWFAGAVLAAVVCAAPVLAQEQTFDKTVPLGAGGSLRVENLNGSVEVRGWDRADVQIHAVKMAHRDATDLSGVTVDVETTPGHVTISTHYPEDKGVDVSVDYEIRVPYRTLLEHVASVNGNVGVANMVTSGDLRTVNGNILAYNCAGSLSAHTTNGSIYEELSSLTPEGETAETVNGSVVLALSPNAGANVDVRSMNGTLNSELPVAVKSAAIRGHLTGKIGTGGPTLVLGSMNGSVQIQALKPTM